MIVIKHGKKPTRAHKELISRYRLDPKNWLVVMDTSSQMVIQNRKSQKTRIIPKG